MPATTLKQTFPLPQPTSGGNGGGGTSGGGGTTTTSTLQIDLFGMDAQTGVALPPTLDPITGAITTPGTNIVLTRAGNSISGVGFIRVALTTTAGGGGPGGGISTTTWSAVPFESLARSPRARSLEPSRPSTRTGPSSTSDRLSNSACRSLQAGTPVITGNSL